ncbi:MAG: TrkH family potassium uptake protein [Muribaculaceae bacterium]
MSRAINIRMILRIIGSLLIIEGLFMWLPVITCFIYKESDALPFGGCALLAIAGGFALTRVREKRRSLAKRDGYLLTAAVWLTFCIGGMMPFLMCHPQLDVSSAFFEAASAFTTTGASVLVSPATTYSHGMLLWQALLQWLGGMGIIVFTLAIVPAFNTTGGLQMFNAEVTGVTHDKLLPRISHTAMALWGVYVALTGIVAVLYWLGPMTLFDSVCHAFGTVSTGGFSNRAGGIGEFNSDYVMAVCTIFMLLGGTSFALIFRAARMQWRSIAADRTFRIFLIVVVLFTACFALFAVSDGKVESWREVVLYPAFMVVSTITSTGYTIPQFVVYEPFILALMVLMMFSGGCAGSTSGGVKIDRLIYLSKYLNNEVKHCVMPNAVLPVRINGRVVNPDLVKKVVSFLAIFAIATVMGGVALSMMGYPFVDSFFSSLSCICNTGIGSSIIGYGDDFTTLPTAAKWVLSLLMVIGRLEVFTIMVLFTRTFWRR